MDHVDDRAGFIAALPKDDGERLAAEEHARSCAKCRDALEEGARLTVLLRRALPATVPSVAVVPAPSQRRLAWATVAALCLAWFFQITVGGGFELDLDCAGESLGILVIAVASVLLTRGRESRAKVAIAVVLVTSAMFAFVSGTQAGLDVAIGVRCSFRELWAAAIAWTIVVAVSRRSGVRFGRWSETALAAGAALAAHAGQHLACKTPHSEAHLLVFHFGALVLATVLGGTVAFRRSASSTLPA